MFGKIKKYFTDLGTAAFKSVPSSGNASTTQVVMGNDSRLTNARTPSSHAANSTTYGGGTSSNYGHVKLTDTYNTQQSSVAAANSVGASAKAVQDAYNALNSNFAPTKITDTLSQTVDTKFHVYCFDGNATSNPAPGYGGAIISIPESSSVCVSLLLSSSSRIFTRVYIEGSSWGTWAEH